MKKNALPEEVTLSKCRKRTFDEVGDDTRGESMASNSTHEDDETLDDDATTDFSIRAVMHILCNLPGLVVGSDMFLFAMTLLEDETQREILALLSSKEAALSYTKYLHTRQLEGKDTKPLGAPCYMSKVPHMTSNETGEGWLMKLTGGNEEQCYELLRMEQATFLKLSRELGSKYGLKSSGRMSILEKVGLFVYALGKGASHKDVQERFQYSAEIVHTVFGEVLKAMLGLSAHLVRPEDPEFKEIPTQIANNDKYMPHFKDCVGVIDCEHIPVTVPEEKQLVHRGRKNTATTNVLAACNFDLQFTYVLAGWEGSAHDSTIFCDAIDDKKLGFPHPPPGKYYLLDKNFPERQGFLTPYRRARYGLSEFRRASPRVSEEIFNQAHSSLRSCIEKAFSVLKARWKILQHVPGYTIEEQVRIIVVAFTLHNFIRRNSSADPGFKAVDQELDFIQPELFLEADSHSLPQGLKAKRIHEMTATRDEIARSLVKACHQSKDRS